MGTSLHEFVAGGLGRQAWTQVHGQVHGNESLLWTDSDRGVTLHCCGIRLYRDYSRRRRDRRGRGWLALFPYRPAGPAPLAARGLAAVLARAGSADWAVESVRSTV
jgi:hypothetical protein